MNIALLGGTGTIGRGLALRWAQKHNVVIGSRELKKAEKAADDCRKYLSGLDLACNIEARDNANAVKGADIVVLTLPYEHAVSTIKGIKTFSNQIIISPVVPMRRAGKYFIYSPPREGSATAELKNALPKSVRVAAAYHTVPSAKLADVRHALDGDVIVCADDEKAKRAVFKLTLEIKNLRPIDGGPLALSSLAEALAPLLRNIYTKNKIYNPSIRFV